MKFNKQLLVIALGVIIMAESNANAQMGIVQPINPNNPVATIETELGTIKIELFEDKVPVTVDNFIKLALKGYYNGVIFHRVIKDFMVQTGDPQGTGMGGPGYTIKDEFSPVLKHNAAGVLSMANAGPNTGGSQFFITLAQTSWLDNKHAVFGQVIGGLDVVKAIGEVETGVNDRPVKPVTMQKVTIQMPEKMN